MKKFTLFLALAGLLLLGACQNQTSKGKTTANSTKKMAVSDTSNQKLPVMTFNETVHNFGDMVQGEVGKYSFHFKNTGNADLRIKYVKTTCGCTVGSFPHKAIKPGGEGDIAVTFNSSFKQGYQNKAVMITANTNPGSIVLGIKAVVLLPKKDK